MPGPNLNTIELDLPENTKPPELRLSDPAKAKQLVKLLVDANNHRAHVDARVKGTLDGVPPFNQAKLNAEAQASRCNVNFREAEGISDAAVTPRYDLFAESPFYCEVKTEHGENVFDRTRWSRILTTELDRLLKNWDGFDYNMQLSVSESVNYGVGFIMWPDNTTWQFDAIKKSKVYVPDGSAASIDKQEIIVIRQEASVHDLWKYIRNAKASRDVGWKREEVLHEIRNATSDKQSTSATDDLENVQQQVRNNDIYESVRSQKVKIAHIFVKEFTGKITHLIVAETGPHAGDKGKDTPKAEFLFEKKGRYDSFRQVLAAFFYDIGDGTWHSVKGLLVKLHPFIEIKNRINCATVDNAFLNMSVLLKPTTGDASQKMGLVQIGPLSILPPNTEVQQWGLAGRMEEGLAVERHLDNKLSSNIGTYRSTVRKENGNPETATKVLADQGKEAMLNKGAVNRFYSQLDFAYEETFRRASNPKLNSDSGGPNDAALEFQKRCKDQGVPAAAFKKVRVRAYRNIGNGSIFMRQQSFRDSTVLVPMMNEEGKMNWLDDAIAVTVSQDVVERYNPKTKTGSSVEAEKSYAALENAAMKVGTVVTCFPTQNHVIHADSHITACSQSLNSVQQGAVIVDVLAFTELAAPHAMEHLQKFANDPSRKRQFDLLEEAWKKMAQLKDQLEGVYQQQQAQQQKNGQRQAQVMNDQQLKTVTARADIERKNQKAKVDMALKTRKTEQSMALKDATTAHQIITQDAANNSERA